MNKRVKRLWLKALRSGEYKQATGWLQADGAFCCLGVLCNIYKNTEHKGRWVKNSSFSKAFKIGRETISGVLPEDVAEWAGLDSIDPRLGKTIRAKTASSLNDSGKSFNYIANRIEKCL